MNFLKKAASLLLEMPPEAPSEAALHHADSDLPPQYRLPSDLSGERPTSKSVEQIVQEAPGPDLHQIAVDESQIEAQGPLLSEGALDFGAVYRAASVPDSPFSAEQMREMLASLPAELPLETKRATVKAMLGTLGKNMGATPETVVADASRKLAALQSFGTYMEKKSGEVVGAAETEIADLQAQIEARRTQIQTAKTELARVVQNCETESEKLDEVLEFFSLDEGSSKYAAQG